MTASKWKVCTGVEDRLMLTATTGWMFCCYSSGPEPASLPSAAELLLASSTDSGRVRLEHANVLAWVSDVLVWCPSMFGFRHIIFHQLKLHAALNGPSHDPKFKMDNFLLGLGNDTTRLFCRSDSDRLNCPCARLTEYVFLPSFMSFWSCLCWQKY